MSQDRITLTRQLHPGIDRDDRATFDGEVASFPATTRGVLKAARTYRATRERDVRAWGNVGAGGLTLSYRGHDVTDAVRTAAAAYPDEPGFMTGLLERLAELARRHRGAAA